MKSESVSFAKITSPKFSGVFQRKRLFTLLDRCCNKPAIWITGQPGAGKTILVSSYLEARELPCIWYQIDSGDEDIATFFYYMGIAAKMASPRRRPLPLFTQEYIPGLAAFTRRYFEELYIRLKPPFCIVFDNYHDVKADALLHDVIRNSMEAIPEGVNIIFISRAELPGAFAHMQADNLIEVIGNKALCLTPEEYTGIARLCSKALQAGIGVEYVQEMIKRRSLLSHPMPDDIENWPWAVKVFTLGRFGIVKDGKGIEFSKKAQHRPLALLKALIALGSRDIREEELSSILWPEAEGDAAHRAFAINLHRLRAIIGEKAIRFRDGRATLNDHYCWVDTWAFERLFGRADAALKMGNKDEAIVLIEKAVLLYQGQFLGHDGAAPCIVPFRERLGSKFLRYINMLSRLYEEKGDFDKAVETLRKGIEASPLSEGFYQSLMSCYQRLGRNAEAMSAYDSLKKTLSAALNIKPSQGSETIRQSIYNSISQAHSKTL